MKLALTNLLPGTYFALFGTVIVSIMLWKDEPQLEQKNVAERTDKGEVRSENQRMRHSESNLDGPAASGGKSGITPTEAAEMMDAIAELLRKNGHEEEAVKTEQAAESLRRPEK